MNYISKLIHFVRPYWKYSIYSLILLVLAVLIDLAIPRLIERVMDQGINQNNMQVVITTTVIMLSLFILPVLFALGNNYYSSQVGKSMARDIREEFLKIQSFSVGNLDHLNTGQSIVRLSSAWCRSPYGLGLALRC